MSDYQNPENPVPGSNADYPTSSVPAEPTAADPYAAPAADPYAAPAADPYAAPAADPYAAPYATPAPDPYAAAAYGAPAQGYGAPGVYGDASSASMAHWLGILIGFIGPLILMLTKGEQDQLVRANAVEALNFQITLLIGYIVSAVLFVVVIGAFLYPVVWVLGLIFAIMGAMAASRGEVYRYPINIRMVS
jgi:uncharacterized Tic20 family protein